MGGIFRELSDKNRRQDDETGFSLLLVAVSVFPATLAAAVKCTDVEETIWVVDYKDKYDEVCKTVTESYSDKECKDVPRVEVQTYYQTMCMTENEEHCQKVWVKDAYGNKSFEKDDDNCLTLPTTKWQGYRKDKKYGGV